MYYKNKNFSKELFKNPTNEYRGAPFWSWNALLEKERLENQIDCFKEMGFGGFYMHPRSGMETDYLSEDYFNAINHCINKAKENGMLSCLYDEDRWPSGFAGGKVTENSKYRQTALYFTNDKDSLPELEPSREKAQNDGKAYFVACFDVELLNGNLKSYKKINKEDNAEFTKFYAYIKSDNPSGRFNNQTGVDYLQKEAIGEFIKVTHNEYYKHFGSEYGKTVPTIFSDEPRFGPLNQMSDGEKQSGRYYWTFDLENSFKAEYGYDIIERLPKLFWDEEGKYSYERYDLLNHTSSLFEESFFKQINETVTKQGLMFCGHMMKEEELAPQICWGGDLMRFYPYFDIPGIDMLFDFREFLTAKQTQSVVRQYGKEGMLSEVYGVTGWDFDFTCLKMQGDWQAAMGVTLRVPHLSMYSMKGSAKRDYPASFNYQSPWYKEFKYLEDHYARLNTAFVGAEDIVDVAVVHPIESVMLSLSSQKQSADDIKAQEENIQSLMENLLYSNFDFDFLCEANLVNQATSCEDKTLNVGKMNYRVVVVPEVKTLRDTTIALLENFKNAGGTVIFLGDCPEYVNGKKQDGAKALFNTSYKASNKTELLKLLEPYRRIKVTADGVDNKKIYRLSKSDNGLWLFIAHAERMGKNDKKRRSLIPQKTVIEVDGEYTPTLYNTLNGEIEEICYSVIDGKTYIEADIYANDSLLLNLGEYKPSNKKADDTKECIGTYTVNNAKYKLHEQNCAVLDKCSVSIDGQEYLDSKCILEQNRVLYKKLWIYPTEVQPYAMKNPKTADIYARFSFESECEFDNLYLALERLEETKIFFNGKKVAKEQNGYYVDYDFKKVKLPKCKKGENIIELKLPFSELYNLEACYLLGDFLTYVDGTNITLKHINDNNIAFKALCEQGLDFYGGNITYEMEIETDNCEAEIVLEDFAAHCIRVFIDGEDAGLIALAPFSVRVPLKKGKHKLELLCYGNRNNTFGPIHNPKINDPDCYVGPWSWTTADGEYLEENCLQKVGILKKPIIKFYK